MADGGPYDIGDEVTLEGTATVDGVLTNATTATWHVRKPDATLLTPAPTATNPSTGVYQGKVLPGQAGDWWCGLDTDQPRTSADLEAQRPLIEYFVGRSHNVSACTTVCMSLNSVGG